MARQRDLRVDAVCLQMRSGNVMKKVRVNIESWIAR